MHKPLEAYEDRDRLKKEWLIIERKFRERFGLLGAMDDGRAASMLLWVVDSHHGRLAWVSAIREVDEDEKRTPKRDDTADD